ncbi:MAG: alpha/beta fold hydrolase [Candidatus Thorarchaeota archaeon]
MVRLFRGKTPKINIDKDKDSSKSIASLEKITINGLKHWVLIRGHNLENPLLLFLHGGPGSPEMGFAHKYERNLEKHFIFVNWDQRGAGKTFSFRTPKESMNVEQFISDGHQLISYLLERFKKKKIVLVGHSWGSELGTLLVQRYPELFYTYIGIGQVVNTEINEQLSFEFTIREAERTKNKKALR